MIYRQHPTKPTTSGHCAAQSAVLLAVLALGGCGGGGGGGTGGPPPTYSVGGSISGLNALGLILANGADTVSPSSGAGTFTFPNKAASGATYAVTVKTQPTGQTCQVSNATGTAGAGPIAVVVSCAGTQWTWLGGSKTADAVGIYGTMGVASAGNIPGARAAAATYTDGQGALWLFGGYGYDSVGSNPSSTTSFLSDLWKYDPAAGAWTWVNGSKIANVAGVYGAKGSAAPDNAPGGRIYAASWTDKQGNFWLFGGAGYISNVVTSADLNDLWKYNPTTNQWTWVSGANVAKTNGVYGMKAIPSPSNMPGAREGAVSWRDAAGALWLFGGYGYGSAGGLADLNDLWKYEPASDVWTWISGDSVGSSPGAYGVQGIPASGNVPGARRFASAWADSNGSFWMFGGNGYDSLGNFTTLNDLWTFNPATAEWTWVSGSTIGNAPGNYGAQDMASPSNVPGARDQAAGWRDGNGKFWIYGGIDFSSTPSNRVSLNDLWKFDPATTQWTWVRGANTPNALGVYGTLGLAAIGNAPGARQLSAAWVDGSNTLWLFGGYGLDSINTTAKSLNDLWFIVPQ